MKKILHAGNIVLVGFGAMILFMSYLVFQCTQNPSVMVSKNYYEQELKYQDIIDASANADFHKDSLTMNKQNGEVIFQIPNSINRDMKSASLQLYNRADDKKDRKIELTKNEQGLYSVNTTEWGQGNYQLKLSIQTDTKQYYKEFNY
jgi:nitrogen fixation protein FixH